MQNRQVPTVFHLFRTKYELRLYLSMYRWILDSKGFPYSPRTHKTDFGRESYGHPKLAQPSSFPTELGQKSPAKGGQLGLTQLIPVELGQKSSALYKEASSCRRAQFCLKRSAHAGELSSTQRGQLMQESSALPKKVSSCRRAQLCIKRSAHAGELSTDQRGQLTSVQEVRSALHKRLTHPGELSSDQRGQLTSAQEVSSSRRAQL